MKSWMKVGAVCVVLCMSLFVAGCNDETIVDVKILSIKSSYNDGECELFPHTIVERVDTHERIMINGYTWGTTGEVFTIKLKTLERGWR